MRTKNILLIGTYGKAGRLLAQKLSKNENYFISLAGRKAFKTKEVLNDLKSNGAIASLESKQLDLRDAKALQNEIKGKDLVVVASPLNNTTTKNLIEAITNSSGCHYIDLSPAPEKYPVFKAYGAQIHQSSSLFLLDAGFDPGLPLALAKYHIENHHDIYSIEIAAVYRDPNIPAGGISDILNSDAQSGYYFNGSWQKTNLWETRVFQFDKKFGQVRCIPLQMEGFRQLHLPKQLKQISFWQGGINNVVNLILIVWQVILRYLLPLNTGLKLLRWGMRNFTPAPYGGIIQLKAWNAQQLFTTKVWHYDLYSATITPVVIAIDRLLKQSPNNGGVYFMGEWIYDENFWVELQSSGLNVEWNQFNCY